MSRKNLSPIHKMLKWLRSTDAIELKRYLADPEQFNKIFWIKNPFPHIVIDDVFTDAYTQEIHAAFGHELKSRQLSDAKHLPAAFSRMPDYDAYNFAPKPDLNGPFRVFYSREWYDLMRRLSGLPFDENILTALHHHKVGSKSGYVHSDLGFYAFRYAPSENQLNHWDNNSKYQTYNKGEDLRAQGDVELVRRSLVLIYYFDHPDWKEGDGGETAFFDRKDGDPVALVAPRPNRLLIFPITPNSLHAFRENTRFERNTLIQWFHEPIASYDTRLGIEQTPS